MAKKSGKGSVSRGKVGKKKSGTADLPAGRKAKTVKGGAFTVTPSSAGFRNTVGGSPFLRFTI